MHAWKPERKKFTYNQLLLGLKEKKFKQITIVTGAEVS